MYFNNKTEIESSIEFLKCFKCETNRNLIPYPLNQIYKSKIKKFKKENDHLYVPVCLKCQLEFQRWNRFNKNYKRKNIESLIYIITVFFLMWVIIENFWINFSLLILISGILLKYNLQTQKFLRKMDYYPKKYIKYTKNNVIYLRSESSIVWVPYLEWIRDILYERYYQLNCENNSDKMNRIIYCINCGAKIKRTYAKCHKCGNLLPLI